MNHPRRAPPLAVEGPGVGDRGLARAVGFVSVARPFRAGFPAPHPGGRKGVKRKAAKGVEGAKMWEMLITLRALDGTPFPLPQRGKGWG